MGLEKIVDQERLDEDRDESITEEREFVEKRYCPYFTWGMCKQEYKFCSHNEEARCYTLMNLPEEKLKPKDLFPDPKVTISVLEKNNYSK